MKVKSIHIQNFKQFDNLELSFENPLLGEISDRFLILGDNGSGKTTLLQAIALPLAFATGRIVRITDFDWTGFLPGRYWRKGPPRIELTVTFEPEELTATREIAHHWYAAQSSEIRKYHPFIEPGNSREVRLILNGDTLQVGDSIAERVQFQGRSCAQSFIERGDYSTRSAFKNLPGIFWFDQFRNLGSSRNTKNLVDSHRSPSTNSSFEVGVGQLRQYLINWSQTHSTDPADRYLDQLETLYRQVFPDRRFHGVEQLPSINSPTEDNTFFLLEDAQHNQYDIAEMSAGEQAVFPILYEFVRQQIAHSIVLIDEIDLNLHPPAAQFLMKQLPRIAPTCQFIVTTHSEATRAIVGSAETYRLAGGALCL